jgi:pre-mRNA-splicing factor ATP-dependent RNA helicase DHX15/PRP43
LNDRNWAWAWNNYLSAHSLSEADNVRSQLLRIMERLGINLNMEHLETNMERLEIGTAHLGINPMARSHNDQTQHFVNIRKALVSGYFMQVAHKEGENAPYLTEDNQV